MRGRNLGNQPGTISVNELYNQNLYLKSLFNDIILVNPVEKSIIDVSEYGLKDSNRKCTGVCPLCKDTCGCICVDIASTKEDRCRFVHDNKHAYLVIGKPIKTKYRDYVLVLIMRLKPTFSFGALSETEAVEQITRLSSNLVIDPLTNIFNRKYLMDNIDYMIMSCQRQNKNLCLACIDIDNFKQFNDKYGHEFGDLVLKTVADLMEKSVAVLNEAYSIRIGGDEFVIVAVGVDKNRFKAIMSKLCMLVDDCKLPYNKESVGVRISIGVSELLSDKLTNYAELYKKADEQLYKAKEAGKGCVR